MQVLLIDDPVQTMDEINMASFVELLRNEFKDKQIFYQRMKTIFLDIYVINLKNMIWKHCV